MTDSSLMGVTEKKGAGLLSIVPHLSSTGETSESLLLATPRRRKRRSSSRVGGDGDHDDGSQEGEESIVLRPPCSIKQLHLTELATRKLTKGTGNDDVTMTSSSPTASASKVSSTSSSSPVPPPVTSLLGVRDLPLGVKVQAPRRLGGGEEGVALQSLQLGARPYQTLVFPVLERGSVMQYFKRKDEGEFSTRDYHEVCVCVCV